MKKLLFMIAAVVILFTACDNQPEHIYDDHSADLVGTWTCFTENYAEALIINADGTAVSYGVEDGEYWENVHGTVVTEGGNITMTFEDDDNLTGHFDIIPGQAFSLFEDSGERYVYQYSANDLADEIIGMWVFQGDENTTIQTFTEDGTLTTTASASDLHPENLKQQVSKYKVVGDLRFHIFLEETIDHDRCLPGRLVYTPNGTAHGDIMSVIFYAPTGNDFVEMTSSSLRVKQNLNLTSKKYAYKSAFVSDVKGTNEDFSMMGSTFNIANIEGSNFDDIFGGDLYSVELNTNSIVHKFHPNGQEVEVVTPITVEGNKVTLDMSAVNPACRKVEMYMFQDVDDSQLHMYMHTKAFINYFANLWLPELISEGKIDATDTVAIEKVYADMEARIESINVSFVFKARK